VRFPSCKHQKSFFSKFFKELSCLISLNHLVSRSDVVPDVRMVVAILQEVANQLGFVIRARFRMGELAKSRGAQQVEQLTTALHEVQPFRPVGIDPSNSSGT